MSTHRYCDWTKERLKADDKLIRIVIDIDGPKEFDLSERAAEQLLAILEADAPVANTSFVPQHMAAEPMEQRDSQATLGDDIAPAVASKPLNLEVPEDTNARLGTPSRETWERVMEDAKRFEPGTLASLTPGSARQQASNKLAELEDRREADLRRQAGGDLNLKKL